MRLVSWHEADHPSPMIHGVSIPELKKSTNLKTLLKPSVQDVWQILDSVYKMYGRTWNIGNHCQANMLKLSKL